jgi:hypothetical protein
VGKADSKGLVGLGFNRVLAQKDALDEPRHFVASFFPIDALDEAFSVDRLSAVHKAPPRESYSEGRKAPNVT